MSARTDAAAPPVLQLGFRPFFLAGPLFALIALSLWVGHLAGWPLLNGPLAPTAWHAHEMLFGFAGAALAGFVLTAVPNWTGRLPLSGRPLALLALLWLSGRIALLVPGFPFGLAAALDLGFFGVLALVVGGEVVAGKNWRNLPVVAGISAFGIANALVWMEAAGAVLPYGLGQRLGIGVLITMIGLVGGRIVPSFTRNWLAKRGAVRLPAPFERPDALVVAGTALALAVWAVVPEGLVTALLLAVAALANVWRLARWRGARTGAEPLVWILHLAFFWVPLGLGLAAAAAWAPTSVPLTAALHALTAGAITLMIVAVMTRATLGHTGRTLAADRGTTLLYLLLLASAVARVAAALAPAGYDPLIAAAGLCWIAGFALYLAVYAPKLLRPRAPAAGERV